LEELCDAIRLFRFWWFGMKIGIYYTHSNPISGGKFSFVHSILESLPAATLDFNHEIIIFSEAANNLNIEDHGFKFVPIKKSRSPRLSFLFELIRALFSHFFAGKGFDLAQVRNMKLNKLIRENRIDILWAIEQLDYPVNIPYATTHWDLGHRTIPIFPELSFKNNLWIFREKTMSRVLQQASLILVGTLQGSREIQNAYGITPERIFLAPLPLTKNSNKAQAKRDPNLFFYPAQFWSHKNHVTLLMAFSESLKKTDRDLKLVLCGGDKGNLEYIKRLINKLGLVNNVSTPGFISDEELSNLYKSARMMIFPSFLGPDNLPPLEALNAGCEVAVSDIPGAREQFGDAVIYFSPNSVSDISNTILGALKHPRSSKRQLKFKELLLQERGSETYVRNVLRKISSLETMLWNWE